VQKAALEQMEEERAAQEPVRFHVTTDAIAAIFMCCIASAVSRLTDLHLGNLHCMQHQR